MDNNKSNVKLGKEEGIYYCTSSSKDYNVPNPKSFQTIKVYGKRAKDIRSSIIISFIMKMYYSTSSRIYQIIFDEKCTLSDRVLNEIMYDLDKLARRLEIIIFIQCGSDYKPNFDNCNSTNNVIVDWNMTMSNDWNEIAKMVSTMAGRYPSLSAHALKAGIINAVDAPLSHVVSNDGSFDFMKCLYSTDDLINLHVEDVTTAEGSERYTLHLPLKSKKIRISATVSTIFSPNDPKKGEKYCDGMVTIDFPNLPGWNKKVIENKVCGNVHRVRMELDVVDLLGVDYELSLQFKFALIEGGNVDNLSALKFYAAISVENLEGDYDEDCDDSFYHDMISLNYVSNLNVARPNYYFI